MNKKFHNNNIRVFNKSKAIKESRYFYISFRDRFHKVVCSIQVFFEFSINQTCFPVLNPRRILRRHTDIDTSLCTDTNIDTRPIEEYKMDRIDKMMTDDNHDANLPSTLQEKQRKHSQCHSRR
jgi:hypothetical protein